MEERTNHNRDSLLHHRMLLRHQHSRISSHSNNRSPHKRQYVLSLCEGRLRLMSSTEEGQRKIREHGSRMLQGEPMHTSSNWNLGDIFQTMPVNRLG